MNLTVRVPATTANLGPGFDALGLALDLWNTAEFFTAPPGQALGEVAGRVFEISGEGAAVLPTGSSNHILRAAQFLIGRAGQPFPPGLHICCSNCIPLGSGLGSSAAACVTGLLGANGLLGNPFSLLDILQMASEIEGHPDNAGPAVLGGLVVAVMEGGQIIARKIPIFPLAVAVVVPEFDLSTQMARVALPKQVTMPDAVFNLGRTALVVEALRTGDLELLGQVMDDRLHQPYRLKLVPGAEAAITAARQAGASAAALSGAGPGVVAFGRAEMAPAATAMLAAFQSAGLTARAWVLSTSDLGANIR
ncbi:MAG TPA: homoserine kinase [Anaerolineaceae bacterium]|jgi:homoserine kinase